MSSFDKRLLSWYESWIIEDVSSEVGRAEKKREEAKKLENAIDSCDYGSDTLQEIIQLLDHETLCYEVHDPRLRPTIALRKSWTPNILNKLSDCLVQAISFSSHFERELQSRALISTLALLRAQGVKAFEKSQYDQLLDRFKTRFQDLRNLQPAARDGLFTLERFRQFQSSYLLCSGAEYATYFERAEPIFITALLRLTDLFYIGASTAILVHTASVAGSIPGTVRQIDNALKPLWRRPNEEYQALFILQELTRKTVAFHLVAKVKKTSNRIDENGKAIASAALSSSLDLAAVILDQILVELKRHSQFETTIRRRSSFWQYLSIICDRGPPAMDTYFYLYGLLDCATQLGRILPYDRVKDEFKNKMMAIIRRSEEESYQWKAVEFLLADPRIRTSESQRLTEDHRQAIQECQQRVPIVTSVLSDCFHEEECQQRAPIVTSVLSDCFREEEEGHPLPQRNDLPTLSQVSSVSSERNTLVMTPSGGWIEDQFRPLTISNEAQDFSISLGDGRRSKKPQYKSAGFSPECTLAFLLGKESICVYSFKCLAEARPVPVKDKDPKGVEYKEAVLSERLLAIITRQDIRIFELVSLSKGYRQVAIQRFGEDSAARTYTWDPNCLALHEGKDRAWISVGGRENRKGVFHGSIKIYRVDLSGSGPWTMARHIVDFNSSDLDALANDFPKTIHFSPDGLRLACVTNKDRVLAWLLSNDAQPRYSPFEIKKRYKRETKAFGVTSAHLFYSPSSHPYILSTTSPSTERVRNGGEWTYISPVFDAPSRVPEGLDQDLRQLGNAGTILTGAATAHGDVIALLEETGTVLLFPLMAGKDGRLVPAYLQKLIKLDKKLSSQEKASTSSLRFCAKGRDRQLHLFAIDTKGKVVWKSFNQKQINPVLGG